VREVVPRVLDGERLDRVVALVTGRSQLLGASNVLLGRPIMAPPEVPADRVRLLRRAFEATMKDPALLKEAEGMSFEIALQADESRIYPCGGGTSLHIYVSPTPSAKGSATRATWYVADLDRVVDELRAAGVTFERYDDPSLSSDEKGIHELDDGRVAWFSDPDGNTFAIEEGTAP